MARRRADETERLKKAMVAGLAETCNVTRTAEDVGVGRTTHYEWVKSDEEYADAVEEALQIGADKLEEEAVRRAVEGVTEPVYYKGEVVGHVKKYSDTLLIFLLKGARPDKYVDRIEHAGKGGGPMRFTLNIGDDAGDG